MKGSGAQGFGECCEELKKAICEIPNPSFAVAEDVGVLYLTIGHVKTKDKKIGWMDQAVMFCPFCGARLQTKESVAMRAGNNG